MTIVTLATVPACIALVNLLKGLGLPARLSPLAAVLLGMLLALFDAHDTLLAGTTWDVVLTALGSGLLLGLAAAGLYDLGGRIAGSAAAPDGAS